MKTKFGIGISLDPLHIFNYEYASYTTSIFPASIYFSLNTPVGTMEPEFGFYSYSYESGPEKNNSSIIKVGIGALKPIVSKASSLVYVGTRISVLFISRSSTYSGNPTY